VSGLKLDVVRNALSRINQEFQKAIGEQGLAGASSLKAAENQVAILTNTFKNFGTESSKAITENISRALNDVATRTGATSKDIQKTLAATPFISSDIMGAQREQFAKQLLEFQTMARRAGVTDQFSTFGQQFLMGKTTGLDLINSGSAAESFIGAEILKRSEGVGKIESTQLRTQVLKEILEDPEILKQLEEMAVETAGYRIKICSLPSVCSSFNI
jgi:hypothetical protein